MFGLSGRQIFLLRDLSFHIFETGELFEK